MSQFKTLKSIILSFPEATEEPHFEKISFRVRKKIFVTYDAKKNQASLKFSEPDQDVFSLMGKEAIYAVPNKWGKQGWTIIDLERVEEELLKDALIAAYCEVAPKKLSKQLNSM